MKKTEQEKSEESSKNGVEQTADGAHQAAKKDHGLAAEPVGQLAAERARDHGGDRKQSDDQPFVLAPSKFGQELRQLRDDHVKAGKEKQGAGANQPELGGVGSWLAAHGESFKIKKPSPARSEEGKNMFLTRIKPACLPAWQGGSFG